MTVFENVKVLVGTRLMVIGDFSEQRVTREFDEVAVIEDGLEMVIGFLELTGDGTGTVDISIAHNVKNTTIDDAMDYVDNLMAEKQLIPDDFWMWDRETGHAYLAEVVSMNNDYALDVI